MEKEKEKPQQKNKLASFARFISLFFFLCFLSFFIFKILAGKFYYSGSGIEFCVFLIFFGYSSYILFRTKKDEVSKKVGYLLIYLIRIGILCLLFFMYRVFRGRRIIVPMPGRFVNSILAIFITIIALMILYFSFKLRKKEFFKSFFITTRKLLKGLFIFIEMFLLLGVYYAISLFLKEWPKISFDPSWSVVVSRLAFLLIPCFLLIIWTIIVIKFLRFKFTEAIVRSKILFIFTFILFLLILGLILVGESISTVSSGLGVIAIIPTFAILISLIGSISGFIIKVRKKKKQSLNIKKIDNK